MRVGGFNVLAVLAAAVAIWLIGFVIYGVLFEEYWMGLTGTTRADAESEMWRMAFSPVMPILTAIGLAVVYRWAGVRSLAQAMKVSLTLFVFFSFVVLLYGWVYSTNPVELLVLDSVHLLLNLLVGGAIIAAWKPRGASTATA